MIPLRSFLDLYFYFLQLSLQPSTSLHLSLFHLQHHQPLLSYCDQQQPQQCLEEELPPLSSPAPLIRRVSKPPSPSKLMSSVPSLPLAVSSSVMTPAGWVECWPCHTSSINILVSPIPTQAAPTTQPTRQHSLCRQAISPCSPRFCLSVPSWVP